MSRPERRDGVLVVGGGYAGLHAVRAVERFGVDATVIDRTVEHAVGLRTADDAVALRMAIVATR